MRNHLVRRKTLRKPPVLLDHALGDDPPLLVRLQPDAPLDHNIPFPTNLSAVVECVRVGVLLMMSDESVIQDPLPDLRRQHLSIVNSVKRQVHHFAL